MTRKEIIMSYGLNMFWCLDDEKELTEKEIEETHKFAQAIINAFSELGGKA